MTDDFTVRYAVSLGAVAAQEWDACAQAAGDPAERHNPFLSHAFLHALERSSCVGAGTGWSPAYTLIENAAGRVVACAPSYIKSNSLGEYVFDQNWAQAYAQAGGRYYPKIQVAVPFTPAPGRRLLVAGDAPPGARAALISGLRGLRQIADASSLHVAFCREEEAQALETGGFAPRLGEQFHFFNDGYRDFDDVLDALSARKRKAIRRERRDALDDGVSIEQLTGSDIRPEHWDAFYAFYMDTGSRKWGRPYLTRRFFDEIGAAMASRVLLVMARRAGRYIAGAINFLGDDAVYGRHWGAIEERPFLHFEVCYYQAIDFALRRGYGRVEAGAQGEHKLARGYRPVLTHSAHAFADQRLADAVGAYLVRERAAVCDIVAEHEAELPFRRRAAGGGLS